MKFAGNVLLLSQKMDEATKLLSATCDTFIKTLEECMKLSSASIAYEIPQHSNDVTLPPTPANANPIAKKVNKTITSSH